MSSSFFSVFQAWTHAIRLYFEMLQGLELAREPGVDSSYIKVPQIDILDVDPLNKCAIESWGFLSA